MSWRDGMAFNALIHKHRPNLFDFNKIYENKLNNTKFAEQNLEHAFDIAQKKLQIEKLLDIEG